MPKSTVSATAVGECITRPEGASPVTLCSAGARRSRSGEPCPEREGDGDEDAPRPEARLPRVRGPGDGGGDEHRDRRADDEAGAVDGHQHDGVAVRLDPRGDEDVADGHAGQGDDGQQEEERHAVRGDAQQQAGRGRARARSRCPRSCRPGGRTRPPARRPRRSTVPAVRSCAPATPALMPRPSRTSSRTGPGDEAPGRRLTETRTIAATRTTKGRRGTARAVIGVGHVHRL